MTGSIKTIEPYDPPPTPPYDITGYLPDNKENQTFMKGEIERLAKKGWVLVVQYTKKTRRKVKVGKKTINRTFYIEVPKPKGKTPANIGIVLVRKE